MGICLLLIGFTNEALYAMIYITIGIGFSGLIASGWRINHQDIACSYSGILAGVSSTIGDSAGILSPVIAGYLTKNQVNFCFFYIGFIFKQFLCISKTIEEWQTVFIISSVILFLGSIFYFANASGKSNL